jgi:hypothetical protein
MPVRRIVLVKESLLVIRFKQLAIRHFVIKINKKGSYAEG